MPDVEPSWTVVVPTKRAEVAKSRLGPAFGPWREHLARAFALDTILAIRSCALAGRIIVVRDGRGPDAHLETLGVELVEDPSQGGDMNAAIVAGLRVAGTDGHDRVAVLTADLPALRPDELSDVLRAAARERAAVVSDAEVTGTTMLASTAPAQLVPRFGHGSFARHVEDGAHPLSSGPGLARDIDLPEHLRAAIILGVGPSTAAVLERAGLA